MYSAAWLNRLFELLSRELVQERSGKGCNRKVQMAELCLSIGRDAIAFPLLNDLAAEIESPKLEEWESPDAVAHPLALRYRCLDRWMRARTKSRN